jgi:NADH-quinone oxidoreductase subunit H
MSDFTDIAISAVKTLILYALVIQVVPVMLWVERRGAALIQDRPGPNRVGPFGLLQPVADVIKMLMKENQIPLQVNRFLFLLGPFLCLLPASLTIAALPFGEYIEIFDRRVFLQIAQIDVGILYILAIGSLGIYGILFGGWASNNKFSLIGAMRATSQIISYEIPLGLAAIAAVTLYGTFSLRDMVQMQEGVWGILPNWGIFYQPLAFFIFFISAFAETNRLPFDLPETEAELVAGFHTEYGSMNFATFFMAEYMNMATMSGIMVSMFFGGWHLPWITDTALFEILGSRNLLGLIQIMTFIAKVSFFMIVFVWVRWTVPRFRYDQLLRLSWRNLIPLGLFNLIVTALVLYWRAN